MDENLGRGGFAVRTLPHPRPCVLCSASPLTSQGKHFPARLMTKQSLTLCTRGYRSASRALLFLTEAPSREGIPCSDLGCRGRERVSSRSWKQQAVGPREPRTGVKGSPNHHKTATERCIRHCVGTFRVYLI